MIKSIYYIEDDAKLIIRTINKNNKQIKYIYREIPYSLYKQIDALYRRNLEGKIWKLLTFAKYEKQEM